MEGWTNHLLRRSSRFIFWEAKDPSKSSFGPRQKLNATVIRSVWWKGVSSPFIEDIKEIMIGFRDH